MEETKKELQEKLEVLRQVVLKPDLNRGLGDFAQKGDLNAVRYLLQLGAEADSYNLNKVSALTKAAGSGSLDIVRLLLQNGADLGYCSRRAMPQSSHSALSKASDEGHVKIVEFILSKLPLSVEQRKIVEQYERALIEASLEGHREVVELLLEKRSSLVEDQSTLDLSKPLGFGDKALQAANRGNYEEIVDLLLDNGARKEALKHSYHVPTHDIGGNDPYEPS